MLASEKIEEMTTRMVHDVRNPLTILNMLSTTLASHLADKPEAQEELAILREEVAKIDKIVSKYRETLRTQI